jgi:SAM-dependent methyltransferase
MDVKERLSLEEVSEHTLIACEHRHRYELAAELASGLRVVDLCCGSGYGTAILAETAGEVHGVDLDAATVDLAAATVGREPKATFEARDALAFLREDLAERFDVIVCFEGLEHLPDVEGAFRELRRHAEAGVRIVASIPNSKAFEEENDFHLTDFGWEEAREAWEGFDGAVMLFQYLAEGSVILADDSAESLDARLINLDYGGPEFANHYLVAVGFDPDVVNTAHRARAQLTVAPVYNRYMRILERANTELHRRNAQLARGLIGRADSGAASFTSRLEQRVADLEQREIELGRELEATKQKLERTGWRRFRRLLAR